MRLLDRYLVRELLAPLGACLSCFFIFWVGFDVLGRLDDFQKEKLRLLDVLQYYWVSVPELLLTVLPVGMLLALLYSLTNLSRHQELTAMRAAGISLWRLGLPYLILGGVASGGLYWLNDVLVPDAADRALAIRRRHIATTNETGWIQRLNFTNPGARRFWNISAFHLASGELKVPSFREPLGAGAMRVVTASTGRWINGAWKLEDTSEFLSRSKDDPQPATKGLVYVRTPEFTSTPGEMATWGGKETVLSNQVWRVQIHKVLDNGQEWTVGAFSPTNGELKELKVKMPLGEGAQRVVGAFSGVWTNGQWRFLTARELLYRSANDSDPMYVPAAGPYPYLDLPHLEEDPDLLRSEAKISSLSTGRAMRRPQLSVREILDYQRLHPDIRPDLAALLATQLHARLAAPWTCLVVVLIAIPFGAPSGRRNIFYGVAGSIAIAFGYFVLQRVGYALAQNGQLPAWFGAWMPNMVFGVLGAVLISRVR